MFWINFLIQIKTPKRKRNAEMFLQRELLLCFILKNQFLCAIFKTEFSREWPKLKDKINEIKKIQCKVATTANLAWCGKFNRFFCQFLKPFPTSNTCFFVNIAWKMNCNISKSKLILCKWNVFHFIEIAFIGFMLHETKQCIVFFWYPVDHVKLP